MVDSGEARGLQRHFKKNELSGQRYEGSNRRAIGLLPDPKDDPGSLIPVPAGSNRRRLLVALEADQRTCCLKIASDKRKSRGALLIFRGRVLGTIYGNKVLEEQLLDQPAYTRLCTDLVDPYSTIDAYSLDDQVVISAAALFHGRPLELDDKISVQQVYSTYLQALIHTDMPGCIVLSDLRNVPVCLAYVFGGRLVGFYSAGEGWLPPDSSIAHNQVLRFPQAVVTASMLEARNVEEVFGLTFSLSGLADRNTQHWSGLSNEMAQSFPITKIDPAKLKHLNTRVQPDRFIPMRGKTPGSSIQRTKGNLFSADP
jgi:hypothetical protein